MTERLLSMQTVCDILGVSRMTIYRMEDRGELKRVTITGRCFGYREFDIKDIVEGRGRGNNLATTKSYAALRQDMTGNP